MVLVFTMSDIIKLLPESVANQIAAGEVVTSPSAAVKEMLENSIDAGATSIHLEVAEGGKSLIHVLDNGCGMSPADARMAFEKHATSKIRYADDLYRLSTMGFRGEALAAIAAISQIELRTRQADDDLGTEVQMSGSSVISIQPCVTPIGTSLRVKDLFFNVPARRRFLRSDKSELKSVVREFLHLALVNPHVTMSLYSDGGVIKEMVASNLKERILAVVGRSFDKKLLSLNYQSTLINIAGFVSSPVTAVRKGYHQYFFVNNRYMKHSNFQRAVEQAFEGVIPEGTHPSFFVYLTVPPDAIDVNISPTKTDIRFVDEQLIFTILKQLVRELLSASVAVPMIDFDQANTLEIPAYTGRQEVSMSESLVYQPSNTRSGYAKRVFMGHNPLDPVPTVSTAFASTTSSFDVSWDKLSSQFNEANVPTSGSEFFETQGEYVSGTAIYSTETSYPISGHLMYKGRYIVTSLKGDLVFIDYKRAHERILYEQYLLTLHEGRIEAQQLMFAERLECSIDEDEVLKSLLIKLSSYGFEIEDEGAQVFVVRQAPAVFITDVVAILKSIVHHCLDTGDLGEDFLVRMLALEFTKVNARSYGTTMDSAEVEDLLAQLFATSDPNLSPFGQPILSVFLEREIEHRLR